MAYFCRLKIEKEKAYRFFQGEAEGLGGFSIPK
jgi:hypothetical protein